MNSKFNTLWRLGILSLVFSTLAWQANAQIALFEAFEGAALPTGWASTGAFWGTTTDAPCAGAGSVRANLWQFSTASTLTSPNYPGASNGTALTISFDYKILDYGFPAGGATPNPWGNVQLQYSTDNGTNWTTFYTIDQSNHVVSSACANVTQVIPGSSLPVGSGIRFRANFTWTSGDYFFYVDNFSMNQVPTAPPMCVQLSNPSNGAMNLLPSGVTLSWPFAMGAPSGYYLYVGTAPGSDNVVSDTLGLATSYSFPSALAENTTYYVTVVPFNVVGTATGCTETFFTTSTFLAGDFCSNAINLDHETSPFSGTTVGAFNDFSNDCALPGNTSPDLVFTVTVPAGWTIYIGQTVNNYNSENTLSYGGACPGETILACYDEPDIQQTIWQNTTGEDQTLYWVQDGDNATDAGTFTLDWQVVNCGPVSTFPACEDFGNSTLPACWAKDPSTTWRFTAFPNVTDPDYGAEDLPDHTPGGGGGYAWYDGGAAATVQDFLTSRQYDVSSLNDPFISFYLFSYNNQSTDPTNANTLFVDFWDGAGWVPGDTIKTNFQGWQEIQILVSDFMPSLPDNILQFRFSGAPSTTGFSFYNDLVIDDVCVKDKPLNDMGVTAIVAPQTGCGLSATDTIAIEITNFGFNAQSGSVFAYYAVNGNALTNPSDAFVTYNFDPGQDTVWTFATTYDFSAPGVYEIEAWTALPGDIDASNDTFRVFIENLPQISTLPYTEDFENGAGGWQEDGLSAPWQLGTPATANLNSAFSGSNCFNTNLTGNYNQLNNGFSYLVSPCMDFSAYENDPEISFWLQMFTENGWEEFWFEVSTDAGNSWTKLEAGNNAQNWYNDVPNGWWEGNGLVSSSVAGPWFQARNTLTGTAGESEVKLRFVFSADPSVQYEGISIDLINITPILSQNLDIVSISHGGGDCGVGEMVMAEIENVGTQPITSFDLSYVFEGDTVTETITTNLLPNMTATFMMSTPYDAPDFNTDYTVDVFADLAGDVELSRNSMSMSYNNLAFSLPYFEDFEDGMAQGFTFEDGESTDFGMYSAGQHGLPSNAIAGNVWNYNTTSWAFSPVIGPLNSADTMTFDYRVVNFITGLPQTLGANDTIFVMISTNCAASTDATVVHTITAANHTTSAAYANVQLPLGAFPDAFIRIGFMSKWGSSDWWLDVDNINVLGCPDQIAINFEAEDEQYEMLGMATATPQSGIPPFNYAWSNDGNDGTLMGLSEGLYVVTVTDSYGCQGTDSVSIAYVCPPSLGLMVSSSPEGTEGVANDGMAAVTASIGTAPFTYAWDNGMSDGEIMGLGLGEYAVTVTDARGCQDVASVSVGRECPPSLLLQVAVTNETMIDANNGAATVTPQVGVEPFDYAWSNGATDATITDLAPGQYSVTITDAFGCTESATLVIAEELFVTSVNNIEGLNSIALSPNPTTGLAVLSLEFAQVSDLTLEVLNAAGQIVSAQRYESIVKDNLNIDLTGMAAGVYFVRLRVGEQQHTERLILNR